MGIRALPRRAAIRGAFVCAALLHPTAARAPGASTARLPRPGLAERAAAFTTRVSEGIRIVRTAIGSCPGAPVGPPGDTGPACDHAARRPGPPEQDAAGSRLRTVLAVARDLLRALAAARRSRVAPGPGEPVSGTPGGPAPYEPLPGRQGPDDDAP
ncbi:hypothetical protein ACWDWS_29030 [Streptomyces sp. NPDC003328]|uniref:hypothetical protein n=1 Tax=Streptomyces sp. NPDC093675 TaxID=3366049 RepID=UPI003811388B